MNAKLARQTLNCLIERRKSFEHVFQILMKKIHDEVTIYGGSSISMDMNRYSDEVRSKTCAEFIALGYVVNMSYEESTSGYTIKISF